MIAAAPILAGGVHRPVLIALMTAGLVGLTAVAAGLLLQGRVPRMGLIVVAPLVFVAVPFLQSIPLPLNARKHLDANGTALLQDDPLTAGKAWPLSLDPPSTRVDVGRAALALMAFMVGYHLVSGKSRRHLLTHVIAGVGVVAVVIGLGHRIAGVNKVYGLFNTSPRPLLVGPFVNPNHNAEFLELAAFVCVACSFQRRSALNRIGWLVGAVLCAGGAAATLSRGSVLALGAGILAFGALHYFAGSRSGTSTRRASLIWAGAFLGLIVVGAVALGADRLVERFKVDEVTTDVRLRLWWDALKVFAAHPFGIGRGAFDRVYPIYRGLKMPFPLRFAFVECEPLQLLVDCGWFFSALFVAAGALMIAMVVRLGRRDDIEAALLAGLFAVAVHNVVDFGLETLGVLLPFSAIAGAVLGRSRASASDTPPSATKRWAVVATAALALGFGVASTASGTADNFDALLKRPMTVDARRTLLQRAERAHPLDYFYALEMGRVDPLKAPPGQPSPRLHDLNRALRLCPTCETVHLEVARNLWRLGLRSQSLLEWRTAVALQPQLFLPGIGELFAAGATPQQLAAVASADPARMIELVAFLNARGRRTESFAVLDQADALGVSREESLLARATLQLDPAHPRVDDAAKTLQALRALGVQNARLAVLQARLEIASRGAEGADTALELLDRAADRFPDDLPVQNERLQIVQRFKKWSAAERSLEGFKMALYRKYGVATDAHLWNARIQGELGHWAKAIDEYRIALSDRPDDISLWIELGRGAETAGRYEVARDAYAQAERLSPNNPAIGAARRGLEARQEQLRALLQNTPGAGAPPAP